MEHLVFTLVTFVLFTALVGIISGKIVKNSDDQKTDTSMPESCLSTSNIGVIRICCQNL